MTAPASPGSRPSPYALHVKRWAGGCGNAICQYAKRVYCRGSLPADILFIGEAPGESENVLGKPFVGPAGQLLDKIIDRSGINNYRLAFTNLVCCIPRDEDGRKALAPDPTEVRKCEPRLVELIRIARPRAVVLVGGLSKKHVCGQATFGDSGDENMDCSWLPPHQPFILFSNIIHPAAILRDTVAARGLRVQRCVVTLHSLKLDLEASDAKH